MKKKKIEEYLKIKKYHPLFEYIFEKEINEIFLDPKILENHERTSKLFDLIDSNIKSTPIPYLTNSAYFYRDLFYVNRNVLIPRPETEYIVERVIEHLSYTNKVNPVICDMCTGTGCIGISISKYASCTPSIILVDKSPSALEVCSLNIQNILKRTNSVQIIDSNLFENKLFKKIKKIDILVSNPPYISENEFQTLDKSVKSHEPYTSLVGGKNGYEITSQLLLQAKNNLANNFLIIIEIGPSQGAYLMSFAKKIYTKANIKVVKDIYKRDRYLEITM